MCWYLGPAGTFTQQAAEILLPDKELKPLSDIESVFENCGIGVVPLENSTEGPVNLSLDALLRWEDIQITALLSLPIRHALMSKSANSPITKILAHPQAHAQCRKYLLKHHPQAERVPCASNGEAALLASQEKGWAAIGSESAAKQYHLQIQAQGIQDNQNNSTSFIQIERNTTTQDIPKPNCRTSIAFATENKPGALHHILGIFKTNGINMNKILSRPIPTSPGEYIFFTDIEDYQANAAKAALTQVKNNASFYRFLGSYQVQNLGGSAPKPPQTFGKV